MDQFALFMERLPAKPYCSDNLEFGVQIRGRETAMRSAYIQANPPWARSWLIFDVDRDGAALAWEDAGLPPPSWAAINAYPSKTAHAHLAYGMATPVLTGDGSRGAPLRYLCAIEAAYRERLRADSGYSGLITKNPLHPGWRRLNGTARLYDLAELAEYVDLDRHMPKRGKVEEIGLGRNCTLFDWLRQWAYVAVRRHREMRNFVLWQAEAYDKALIRNGDFASPLDPREVWHISASVVKWTWAKDADARARFVERQQRRGRRGGRPRTTTANGRPWEEAGVSRATWYRLRDISGDADA